MKDWFANVVSKITSGQNNKTFWHKLKKEFQLLGGNIKSKTIESN